MNFIQQAYKGKNEWWKYLLISSIVLYPYASYVYSYLMYYVHPKEHVQFTEGVTWLYSKELFKTTGYFVIFLILFKTLHKRKIRTLITSERWVSSWRFFFGFSSWSLFIVILFSIEYFRHPENYIWNFELVPFLKLFIMCITLLFLRVVFLEMFLRGYLLQIFGVLTKRGFVSVLITSVIFTIMFGVSSELNMVGYDILIYYFASALLAGVITLLDDGIEIAIGIHFATNFIGMLYITHKWYLFRTDAFLLDTSQPKVLYLVYIPVFILIPLYFLLLQGTYQWKSLKEKIFGKISAKSFVD